MHHSYYQMHQPYPQHLSGEWLHCDWAALKTQLLNQWRRLTTHELDDTGPDRHEIAVLVQRKYGIAWELVENYLSNLERTLPLEEAA